jgi:hypothetical protein
MGCNGIFWGLYCHKSALENAMHEARVGAKLNRTGYFTAQYEHALVMTPGMPHIMTLPA